jgi:hypothetical protein
MCLGPCVLPPRILAATPPTHMHTPRVAPNQTTLLADALTDLHDACFETLPTYWPSLLQAHAYQPRQLQSTVRAPFLLSNLTLMKLLAFG